MGMLYHEIKLLHKEMEKTNALILSVIPEEKLSSTAMAKLKEIKAEMDAGHETAYSKDVF